MCEASYTVGPQQYHVTLFPFWGTNSSWNIKMTTLRSWSENKTNNLFHFVIVSCPSVWSLQHVELLITFFDGSQSVMVTTVEFDIVFNFYLSFVKPTKEKP